MLKKGPVQAFLVITKLKLRLAMFSSAREGLIYIVVSRYRLFIPYFMGEVVIGSYVLACPPKVVPSVKLVVV